MEFTIKKIVSIDRDAENYRNSIEQSLEEKRKEINLLVQKLNSDAEVNVNNHKKEIMDKYLSEATIKAKKISEEKEEEVKKINYFYNKIKDNIVNEVFDEVINSI